VLAKSLVIFKQERPRLSFQDWFLSWVDPPIHIATYVQESLAAKRIKMIPHPSYSLDITPADYFLFPIVKSELAGLPGQLQDKLGWGHADHRQ
jgi:hypothetical protein